MIKFWTYSQGRANRTAFVMNGEGVKDDTKFFGLSNWNNGVWNRFGTPAQFQKSWSERPVGHTCRDIKKVIAYVCGIQRGDSGWICGNDDRYWMLCARA